jgi:cell wall-associated NlpC family hydrolase
MAKNYHHAISVPVTTLWRSPSSIRPVDEPAVADQPDPRAWPVALGKSERLDLLGRVDSQLLLGEPVELVDEDGDWVKVIAPWQPSSQDERGYPGWVRRAHVASAAPWNGTEFVATVDSAPLEHAGGPLEATFGTILPVLDSSSTSDTVRVALPGQQEATVNASDGTVRRTPADRTAVVASPADVLATARRFAGLQYLWSGVSAYGLDCSGLVHLSYRALGRVIPRDADDQAEAGQQLPVEQAQPGDLRFFSRDGNAITHVGFTSGADRILHAPKTGHAVVEEPTPDERKATQLPFAVRIPAA